MPHKSITGPVVNWGWLLYNEIKGVLVKTPGEIAEQLRRGNFFLRQIVTEGRVLYDRHA